MYYLAHIVEDCILQKPYLKLRARYIEQTTPILAGVKKTASDSTVLDCPTDSRSFSINSSRGTPPTDETCLSVATLATDLLSIGFFSFLKGGATPINTSSSSGYYNKVPDIKLNGKIPETYCPG